MLLFFSFLYYLVFAWTLHHTIHVKVKDSLQDLVLPFYHIDWIQVVRLGGREPLPNEPSLWPASCTAENEFRN